jgi:hypothetical protein
VPGIIFDFLGAAGSSPATEGDGRDWLTLIVAIYGSIVATGVAGYQFLRDRPGVKLRLAAVANVEDENRLVRRWSVRIVNHRQRPITIDQAGVLVNGGQQLQAPIVDYDGNRADPYPFPMTLADGEGARVFVNVIEASDTEVMGAWARDALGRDYKTRRSLGQRWRVWRLNRRLKQMFKSG